MKKLATSRKLRVLTDISINNATKPMAEAVFKALVEGKVKRASINLTQIPSTVDAGLLSEAVLRVERPDVCGGKVAQLQPILASVLAAEDFALKKLSLSHGQLAQVSVDLVAGVALKLNTFYGNFNAAQLGAILTRLANTEESTLRKLGIPMEFGWNSTKRDLTNLPPEILSNALVKLESLDILREVSLSAQQVAHLLAKLRDTENLRLTELRLHDLNISLVSPAVLAGVLSRMESVEIWQEVTTEQLVGIFAMLANQQSGVVKLKTLEFSGPDVTSVDPEILAGGVMRLEGFATTGGTTSAQIGEILTQVAASEDLKLRRLKVSNFGGQADLGHLSPEIVSEALLKLKTGNDLLHYLRLSPEQVAHLFAKIKDAEELKITEIDLRRFNISQVSPDLMAGAVSRLEHVQLPRSAAPTPDQVAAIFTMLANRQLGTFKLNHIQLKGTDLRSVAPEVLVQGLPKLRKMRFEGAKLTTDQLTAILVMVREGRQGKLKTLWIEYSDVIGEISPDLLQSAMEVGKRFLEIYPRPGATASDMEEEEDFEMNSDIEEAEEDFEFCGF